MSKTNKTVAVVVGGKTLGVGAVEDQAAYGNEVVRGDAGVVAFTGNSGVFGDKGGWFAWVDRKLTSVEVVETSEVALVDLSTADLDALLG